MCTLEKRGNLFILTLTGATPSDIEHRLSPAVLHSILSALASVKSQAPPTGSALLTLSHGKFFSNGLDLRHVSAVAKQSNSPADAALSELRRLLTLFGEIVAALLSLPMPTIAAVNGHAAAAGMVLAMSHDYVAMTSEKGFMYMSELDMGMTFPDYFTAFLRGKVGSGKGLREVMLAAGKVRAEEAVRLGIVDWACETAEEAVEVARKKAEEMAKKGWNGEVYGEIRKAMYPEVCGLLGLKDRPVVKAKL